MKKRFLAVFILLSVSLVPALCLQTKLRPKDLPERYRKWLEEEVVYIISSTEKDVFLQLQSNRERDIFIDAFWRIRDPNPATPENEYKIEHYRRIQYANKFLGRGTPTVGWRTEKGRIYIILGEPNQIEKFENETELVPTEIWFYQGMGHLGLNDAFNVVFFQKDNYGDWELYSPTKDGPRSLLRFYDGDRLNIQGAYEKLYMIQPAVAQVSVSLIPGSQRDMVTPSMASDVLISRVFEAPKKIEDEYAEKLLRYKDIIEVDYSANYIGNDSLVQAIGDKSGVFFVHYLVEPKKLSIEKIEDTYYTNLEITGQVTDAEGKTIYQFNKQMPIRFNQSQFEKTRAMLFSYQDAFPLVAGSYNFHLLMKNKVSKEFTSFEKKIVIPSDVGFQMSPLLLAPTLKDSPHGEQKKAFKVGGNQIYPSPRNDFSRQDTLHIFWELYNVPTAIRNQGKLRMSIFKNDVEVWSKSLGLNDAGSSYQFLEKIPLADMLAANYQVKASVFDAAGKEILSEQEFFYISHRLSLPRPFVSTELLAPPGSPIYNYILGGQFFNKGLVNQAKDLLEKAYRASPNTLKYALGFSQVLFASGRHQEVIDILSPFIQGEEKQHSCYNLLGKSYFALGKFPDAVEAYKAYLNHFGTNLRVLNDLGECYLRMGNQEEALIAWNKSLELEPNQKELREKVLALGKKK